LAPDTYRLAWWLIAAAAVAAAAALVLSRPHAWTEPTPAFEEDRR
jgi:hypothetical protein